MPERTPCPQCKSTAIEEDWEDPMCWRIRCLSCKHEVRGANRTGAVREWQIVQTTIAPPKPTRASEEDASSAARVKRVFGAGEGSGPLAPGEVPECDPEKPVRRNCLGPERPNTERGGMKNDDGKDRFELLPWGAIRLAARVMTRALTGPNAYDRDSWKTVPDAAERYKGAMQRHFVARYHDGEKNDADSGLPHLAHMVCCALFLLTLDEEE